MSAKKLIRSKTNPKKTKKRHGASRNTADDVATPHKPLKPLEFAAEENFVDSTSAPKRISRGADEEME
jgi:hypothetical protein